MATEPKISRKWPRRVALTLLVLIIVMALFLLAARLVMRSSWGHGFVEAKIESIAPAGQSIEIKGMNGDLLGHFQIEKMTISDAQDTWMNVHDIDVKWSPWSLLRRDVVIDSLSVSSAQLSRRPIIVPSHEPLSVPFKSYSLENLSIPELDLAQSVFGREVSVAATGGARHGQKGGALKLDSHTLNSPVEDSAIIDLKWSPAFLLTGDAKIIGEAGGLIASFLNFGTQDTMHLDVITSGTQENLTTTLNGRLDERAFLTGEIRKIGRKADITANLSPKVIPKFESFDDILGGDIALNAAIDDLSENARITAQLIAPKLEADFIAAKSAKGYHFPKLEIIARAPLSSFPDTPASAETIRLSGSGALEDAISFSGNVQALSVKYKDYEISSIDGPLALKLQDTVLDFDSRLTGDVSDLESFAKLVGGNPKLFAKGQYDLQNKAIILSASDVQLPGLKVTAQGRASLSDATADMSGSFNIEKGILDGGLPASLSGRFETQTIDGKIALDVTGNAEDFKGLHEPLPQLLGDTAVIKAQAIIESGRTISVNTFSVSGDDLSVTGRGDYGFDGAVTANVDYAAGGFAIGNTKLSSIKGIAKASGRAGAVDFDLAGTIPGLIGASQELSDVNFSAKGRQSGQKITADIDITGESDQGEISLETEAVYANGRWAASNADVKLGDLSVKGNLSGRGAELAQLSGDFRITGDPSQYIPAEAAAFDVTLSDSVVEVSGELSAITSGPLTDGALTILAKGPRDAVNFDVKLRGETVIADINRDLNLAANGRVDLTLPLASIETGISGNLGDYQISTSTPLTLSQTDNGLRGDGALNLLGGGLAFALDAQSNSLTLSSESLKMADILSLMGRAGLEGRAAFKVDLRKTANGFDGELSGNLTGVRQPGSEAKPLDTVLTGQLIAGQMALRAESNSDALTGAATLDGNLTTSMASPFIEWPPASPLRGEAIAQGSIMSLMDLFMPPETKLGGELSLDMRYSLPLDARGLKGSMSLTGGSFEQGDIGLILNEIEFASIFDGATLSVSNLTAKDNKSGTLTGSGKMDFGFEDGSTINLTANKLRVLDRREGFAVMSGDLKLDHDGDRLALKGGLIVDDASVSIANLPSAGRPTLDVSFSEDETQEEKPVKTATELDIKISSPSRIKLTGRGVNASMALKAHLTGAFNVPILSGETEITRGRFDFLGKRFDLKDSKVVFNDDIMQSRLAVAALRETAELTAAINVTGTVSRPEIELTSTPEYPEDEVLSRILFGRSASQLTTIETARLAAALAQLSGGGGFDLMGGLENALGLDTLDFGQSDSGQTQLTTGKYLSDNVYVEVRSSAEGTPGLAVEWTPKKNISIEAETAPGETQRVSVQWQKDFD